MPIIEFIINEIKLEDVYKLVINEFKTLICTQMNQINVIQLIQNIDFGINLKYFIGL